MASFLLLAKRGNLTTGIGPNVGNPALHRLFCPNPLPDPNWTFGTTRENWQARMVREQLGLSTSGWSSKNFTSLEDLCSSRGNQQANMGGKVPASPHLQARSRTKAANSSSVSKFCAGDVSEESVGTNLRYRFRQIEGAIRQRSGGLLSSVLYVRAGHESMAGLRLAAGANPHEDSPSIAPRLRRKTVGY